MSRARMHRKKEMKREEREAAAWLARSFTKCMEQYTAQQIMKNQPFQYGMKEVPAS